LTSHLSCADLFRKKEFTYGKVERWRKERGEFKKKKRKMRVYTAGIVSGF